MLFPSSQSLTNGLTPDQNRIFKELIAKTEKVVKLDATSKLLWVDSHVDSPENKIYQKAFINRGFENFQTMLDIEEFKQELPALHNQGDLYVIVGGRLAEQLIQAIKTIIKPATKKGLSNLFKR